MVKKFNWLLLFIGVCLVFFYPIFMGKIPFPGDLLISEYSPWKYFSFLGYAPGGYPEKFQYFDTIRQIYPWTTFVINSIRSFQFPLWNPYNFSGSPLFANSQSAVLYPLHVLYFIFPQVIAWAFLVLLQPLLISIFTYLFGRKIGLGKWGSIFSSIAFSYSLFVSVFLEYNTIDHVIIFLPLLLLLTELIFEKKTFWRIIAFVVSIVSAAFAGHIQIFGFVLLFAITYVCWKIFLLKKDRVKESLFFSLFFILGLGIALIQLIPTFELIHYAARGSQEYSVLIKNLLLQWYQSILFLSPDIFGNPATKSYLFGDSYPGNAVYIGLIPFIFSTAAVFLWKKIKTIQFFGISAIVLLILFFNSPFTQIFYKFQIPLFSTGSPTNAIFLLSFSLSILAGFGLEEFIVKHNKKALLIGSLLFCFFIVCLGLFKIVHLPFITKNVLYTLGLFIAFFIIILGANFLPRQKRIILLLILFLTTGDLLYFSHKFNPFVKESLVFPETPILTVLKRVSKYDRFWSYGNAEIAPNFATQYQLFDPNGYDPLYSKTYGIFINSVQSGRLTQDFSDLNRSDALLPGVFTAEELLKNKNELKALNFLNIRYIVAKSDPTTYLLPTNQFKLIFESEDRQIFENKDALPRVFLAYKTEQYSNDAEFGKIFYSDSFDPKSSILLHKQIHLSKDGFGNATIVNYSPNKISIQTISTQPAVLVLTDTYFPGWKATIDGKAANIFPADYAFRGVEVPAGKHSVTFEYKPSSFSLGLLLSILSLVGTFIIATVLSQKKYA